MYTGMIVSGCTGRHCSCSAFGSYPGYIIYKRGPGSSVGKATELWAGRFGIESWWGRDFPPVQSGPGGSVGIATELRAGRSGIESWWGRDFSPVQASPGGSVGIVTELQAGRSGIESWWGRDFPPVQTSPGAHPASCKMGTGSFPGAKCSWGMLLTTHPLLVPQSWKSRAIPLPTLWATPGL